MILLLISLLAVPGAQSHSEAFLEVEAGEERYYVGQTIGLALRFGFEREFLDQRLVQPYQRQLDVPARLELPWIDGTDCAVVLPPESGAGPTFALGDDVVTADGATTLEREGLTFAVVTYERHLVPTCAGELILPGGALRYTFASSFSEGVFDERVPTDPLDAVVHGAGLRLVVVPLPEEGRPLGFTGAVGRFSLTARLDRPRVAAGESFELQLTIDAEAGGDPARFALPRFDGLAAFTERGRIDSSDGPTRVVTIDLATDDPSVREVPALALPFFDPRVPGYRSAESPPLPIEVRAVPREQSAPASAGPDVDGDAEAGSSWLPAALGGALVALALIWVRLRRARRDCAPTGPAGG